MGRRRNRRRRLFLSLIPILSLDPYLWMPWLLYHYAMALWHHLHGARYQAQRLSKGRSVEKRFCAILRSVGSPLGVVEVIRMGLLYRVSTHTFPLYLALASNYCSDV